MTVCTFLVSGKNNWVKGEDLSKCIFDLLMMDSSITVIEAIRFNCDVEDVDIYYTGGYGYPSGIEKFSIMMGVGYGDDENKNNGNGDGIMKKAHEIVSNVSRLTDDFDCLMEEELFDYVSDEGEEFFDY